MPVWPKILYTFGLSLKTASTEWKLRQKRSAVVEQQWTFGELTRTLATATWWREAGVEAGMPYARFQSRLPLQTYQHLAPGIEQTKAGERDVLWPGTCALFALSSGTATGESKCLPVTEPLLAHFRRATSDALLYYTVRAKNAGVFRGRHLLVGSSTAFAPITDHPTHKAYASELAGIVEVCLPGWAESHLYEPGAAAAQVVEEDARIDAIIDRVCGRDISLVAGLPTWVAEIATDLRQRCANTGHRLQHLQSLWPNLECFVHTGIPMGPYANLLRALLGPSVKFHEVYAAAEGFIATQDSDAPAAGLRLMADLGIFFEFLPHADFEEGRLPQLGAKAVPLDGVKAGVDYVIILTTPGGLARYVLGDVVRFVSTHPPRLLHVGRTELQLQSFGERVLEKELTDALVAMCGRHQWTIVNFHVAPQFGSTLTGVRGRHEWWIELRPGTVATPTGPQLATELEVELQRSNPDYTARRKTGAIDAPVVRLVMPGVFEHWLRYQKRWGGLNKLPRSRNDRLIADELAQITHFARD